MAKCGVCGKFVAAQKAAKCNKCSITYHRGCEALSDTGVISTGWSCTNCTNKSRTASTDVTKEFYSPDLDGNPSSILFQDSMHNTKDTKVDLAQEIRFFRNELSALRSEVRAYRDEIADFKSALNTCNDAVEAIDGRVSTIEKLLKEKWVPDATCDDAIVELECQINERHQELLANDVEIAGVPEHSDENLMQLVETISQRLGVNIDEKDVVHVERVGSIRYRSDKSANDSSVPGSNASRPRNIAVRFGRRVTRELLIRAARVKPYVNTGDISMPGPSHRLYFNERLTSYNKWLFYHVRRNVRHYNWKYIWTKNGNILVRKADGEHVKRIRLEKDIHDVFKPESS